MAGLVDPQGSVVPPLLEEVLLDVDTPPLDELLLAVVAAPLLEDPLLEPVGCDEIEPELELAETWLLAFRLTPAPVADVVAAPLPPAPPAGDWAEPPQ